MMMPCQLLSRDFIVYNLKVKPIVRVLDFGLHKV